MKLVAEVIEQKGVSLLTGVDEKTNIIADVLDERTGKLEHSIDSRSSSFADGLETRIGAIATAIDEKSSRLLGGIDSRKKATQFADAGFRKTGSTKFQSTLEQKSASLLSGLQARNEAIDASIDTKAGELGAILAKGEEAITNAVENKYGLFSKMLAERQSAISTELDEKIEDTAGTIDQKAAAISEILTERAAIINSTLGAGLTDSQRMLETKTREFNELLASRSSELSTILDESALPLVDKIRVQGDEVAAKLSAVHQAVDTDVSTLLEKLGSVSDSMGHLIVKASDDLGQMKETITKQADSMSEAVGRAREDVTASTEIAQTTHLRMDETANNLLANIGLIAERFEQQGSMLEHATSLIDNAQRNFSLTLEDREGALEQLATGLSQRTSEIEKSMAAFGEMLTRTMDEMTQRSRMVGTTVSTEVGTAIEETTARFAAATGCHAPGLAGCAARIGGNQKPDAPRRHGTAR